MLYRTQGSAAWCRAGPPPLPVRGLDAGALAARIGAAVRDERIRARAPAAGHRIRAEDGVANAGAIIEPMI